MIITVPHRELFHWRRSRRGKQEVAVCRRITIATVLTLGMSTSVIAAPEGGVVTLGSGVIAQSGAVTDVTQSSQRLDIDWNSFSITAGETVNFAQPNNLAVAINRVVGGVPSELSGALNANGRVFILNQAGVVFHQSAQVNVGALLATTAADVNVSALIGGEAYSFSNANSGSVINHGNITVSDGGFAILAAPSVHNTGMIQADMGEIHLAATTAYTLDLRGDGLINFAIPTDAAQNVVGGVSAGGSLRAHSGLVSLDARTATDAVKGVVNFDGVIDADAVVSGGQGGKVMLAAAGDVLMGQHAAIHVNNGATGEIALNAGGNIDAGNLSVKSGGLGDISALVSAHAGGSLKLGHVSVDAVSDRLATAKIDLRAGGNITVANGLSATSLASTDKDKAPYSVADIAVYSDHGGITLTGETLAVSTAHGHDGAYEFGTAEAHTNINVSAARALTTHGDVALRTDAYFGGERGDSETHTKLGLHSRDSGDITLNGDIAIDSLATRNVYRSAEAVVKTDISAAGNLFVNGGVNINNRALAVAIGRSGHHTDGACMASADTTLTMQAGTAGQGDLIITQGLNLDGYARLHFGGTHSANAFITASLKAANDIVISGETDALKLSAVGHNTAQSATKTFAYIDLDMAAGTAGTGDVRLNGNLTAKADAYLKDGKFLNGTAITATMISPDDIHIDGDVSLTTTLDAVTTRRGSRAETLFTATAGNDGSGKLTISGDTHVSVHAKTVGTIEQAHTTTAKADLSAAGDIQLGGLSVIAHGDYSPGSGSDADVDAHALLTSSGNGDITLNGDLLVTAEAIQRVAKNADAHALANFAAAKHLTVNGDISLSADAQSAAGADDALASSQLVMQAGMSGSGNLHITGDIFSKASAHAESGLKSSLAHVTLSAADDLTVHGADPRVEAGAALVQGRESGEADQSAAGDTLHASLSLNAGGTLTVDIPPPPPEPEPVSEPEPEGVSEPAASAPSDDGAGSGVQESRHQAHRSAEPTPPDNSIAASGHQPAKVKVSVISAFHSSAGPRRHAISVSTKAAEHGAMAKESPSPMDGVVFEIDWDDAGVDGPSNEPLSALNFPLNDQDLAADKGVRKRR